MFGGLANNVRRTTNFFFFVTEQKINEFNQNFLLRVWVLVCFDARKSENSIHEYVKDKLRL